MKPNCYVFVAVLIVVFATGSTTDAAIISGPVTNPANGHIYYLLAQANWTDSEAEAITLGGHLVTVNDAAENTWVHDTFGAYDGVQRNLWTGYNDEAADGTYVWASGETPGYTNWNSGEPNSANDGVGGEDYAAITPPVFSASGVWNDTEDTLLGRHSSGGTEYPNHGVVEVIPEPASALLLIGAAAMIALFRRRA